MGKGVSFYLNGQHKRRPLLCVICMSVWLDVGPVRHCCAKCTIYLLVRRGRLACVLLMWVPGANALPPHASPHPSQRRTACHLQHRPDECQASFTSQRYGAGEETIASLVLQSFGLYMIFGARQDDAGGGVRSRKPAAVSAWQEHPMDLSLGVKTFAIHLYYVA